MAEKTQTFTRWLVEGSNGQTLCSPGSFEEALELIAAHQQLCRSSYSASGPPPSHLEKAWADGRLGYILRKVYVKVVETYD